MKSVKYHSVNNDDIIAVEGACKVDTYVSNFADEPILKLVDKNTSLRDKK